MAHMVIGLFNDSKSAGKAVAELHKKGYTDDISVIAQDEGEQDISSHQVKQDTSDGIAGGAVIGGILGGLTGLALTIGTVLVPGIGTLVVAGPLAAAWGLGGAATGALAGGIVGGLVDAGIPEERARSYEKAIRQGQVLVAVTTDHEHENDVRSILNKHSVGDTATTHAYA